MFAKPIRSFLVALAVCAAALLAHAAAARPHEDPGRFIAQNAERLGLEPAQLEAIQRVIDESRARDEALGSEARRTRDALHALLSGANADRNAVMAAAAAVDAAMANLHHNRLDALLQIHALLSPTQREELVKIRQEEWGGRRGHGCAADVDALCADAGRGLPTLQCLADHFAALSPGCRRSIDRLGEDWQCGSPPSPEASPPRPE